MELLIRLNWFYLILIYISTNATSKILQKYIFNDTELDPAAFSAFFMIIGGLLAVPLLYFEAIEYPQDITIWLILLLASIFYTISMLLFFYALKEIEISQVETIGITRTIWLILLGIIFYQEKLNLNQYFGIFLVFLGLVVIYCDKKTFHELKKPHLYALLYAIIISCAYALDKYLLSYFSLILYNVVIYIIPGIFTMIFIPNTFEKMKYFIQKKTNTYICLLSCVFMVISTLALYAAYQSGGELSLVGPLAQTSTIFTILIGLIILKEYWNLKRKIIGITIAVLGIVFVRFIIF